MKEIKLYYFTTRPNFGDLLNEYICEKLFNCKLVKTSVNECEACFIGSILTPFFSFKDTNPKLKPLKVWGSGLINKIEYGKKPIRNMDVFALRGKVTKQYLETYTRKKYDNIVLGDPGLLCSKVFDASNIKKEYEWGIIPHYVDRNNENLKKLQLHNSIILDICEQPEVFLSKLVKCKKIISSAMHGLIAADSFCIPNIRMVLDDKIIGGDFKFNDYYSVFNYKNHNKIDLRKRSGPITEINFDYKINEKTISNIQNNLIKSFPYA